MSVAPLGQWVPGVYGWLWLFEKRVPGALEKYVTQVVCGVRKKPITFSIWKRCAIEGGLDVHGRCVATTFCWIWLYSGDKQLQNVMKKSTRLPLWNDRKYRVRCGVRMAYKHSSKDHNEIRTQSCFLLHYQSQFGSIRYYRFTLIIRLHCQVSLCILPCVVSEKSFAWLLRWV